MLPPGLFRLLHGDQPGLFRFPRGHTGLFRSQRGQPGLFRFLGNPFRISLLGEQPVVFVPPLATDGGDPVEIRRKEYRQRPMVLGFVVAGQEAEQDLIRVVIQ